MGILIERRALSALLGLMTTTALLATTGSWPGGAVEPASAWPVVQHDRQHTGRSDVAGPISHAVERCTADLTGSDMGAPVVGADGTIYVVSGVSEDPASDWRLHALNPDCSRAWSFRLPGWPARTVPAVGPDGTVYVHTNGVQNIAGTPHLVAVNPDGTQAWDLLYHGDVAALSSSTPSAPVVATDGTIWFGRPTPGCTPWSPTATSPARPSPPPSPRSTPRPPSPRTGRCTPLT